MQCNPPWQPLRDVAAAAALGNRELMAAAVCVRVVPGCRVLGVEIDDAAVPVQSHPFTGNTAFMLGNEVCTEQQASARITY